MREAPQQAKVINMIRTRPVKEKKRKAREATEIWMNTPITFLSVSAEDVSEEPIIIEAKVEGYLVRRVYLDERASMEAMFEHCFKNLSTAIKARLRETQTDLVGFAGEVTKPLGKIELEVCFGSDGLCRRTTMKFTVIRAPPPYNVILGRRLEKKPMIKEKPTENEMEKDIDVSITKEVLVNPAFPNHLVIIGGGLLK
ncbi:reverse transcriptase domain-containing protein, partial [Tanacetum coccineum]